MQDPNSELIEHDENNNQEFKPEHDVESHVHSKLGKQDQEFTADDLTPQNECKFGA